MNIQSFSTICQKDYSFPLQTALASLSKVNCINLSPFWTIYYIPSIYFYSNILPT